MTRTERELTGRQLKQFSTHYRPPRFSINAAGSIEIQDLWSRDDQLEFRHVGSELWVTDLTQDNFAFFTVTGLATVTGNGTKQIRIPVSVIAAMGKPLIVNALGGDDQVISGTATLVRTLKTER